MHRFKTHVFLIFLQAIYGIRVNTRNTPKWQNRLVCEGTKAHGWMPYDLDRLGCDYLACMGYERDGKHGYDLCVSDLITDHNLFDFAERLVHISLLRLLQPNVFTIPLPGGGQPIKVTLDAERMFSNGYAVNFPYEPRLWWSATAGDAAGLHVKPGGDLRSCPDFGVSTVSSLALHSF